MPRSLVFLLVFASGVSAMSTGLSQTPANAPQFEVATVKPTDPNRRDIGFYTYPGGRVAAHSYTLQALIAESYGLKDSDVSGGPDWMRQFQFDIEAKPPETSASLKLNPTSPKAAMNSEQREMLRFLLEDRFSLKVHKTMAQRPVFVLERTGKPLMLKKTEDDKAFPWAGSVPGGSIKAGDGLAGKNISMAQLAARLSGAVGRPVVDGTGLEGAFDFVQREDDEAQTDVLSTVLMALSRLGLRLRSSTGAVLTVVVDQVQKPSAN